jgi:phospholipid transport system substrate-binding protein
MWRCGATLCALVALGAPGSTETPPPAAVVERLNAALLEVLEQAEALGYRGRVERLAPVVAATFDQAFMAEKVLGRHWKGLGEQDRRRWVELFAELTTASYAGSFDRFSGQRFEVLGEEPGANGTRIVRTRLVNPGGEDVELSYRLQAAPAWRIVDVYLKGTVSELALRRSDYASVLQREGFGALLTSVRARIDDLAAGRNGRPGR